MRGHRAIATYADSNTIARVRTWDEGLTSPSRSGNDIDQLYQKKQKRAV